jgi:Na+-driven multidrug efflux pump
MVQVRSLGAPAVMLVAVGNGALRGYLDTATPALVAVLAFIVDYSIDPEVVYPQGQWSPDDRPCCFGD